MNRRYRRQKPVAEINITPFTDVILVLLVIFMITTPLLSQTRLKVKLPQASSAQSTDGKAQVSITITREGPVFLEKEMVTVGDLKKRMFAIYSGNPSLAVMLSVDRSVQFKNVVKVLDVLSELGIRNLNIAAEKEQ